MCLRNLPLNDFYSDVIRKGKYIQKQSRCKACVKAINNAIYHDPERKAKARARVVGTRLGRISMHPSKAKEIPLKQCRHCYASLPLVAFRQFQGAVRVRTNKRCRECFAILSGKPLTPEQMRDLRADITCALKVREHVPVTAEEKLHRMERVKAWRLRNRDKYTALDSMYKRKARNPRFIRDWPLIVKHYGSACIHCKSKEIASDHVVPLTPEREDLNCLANLQPLCRKCNSGKSGLAHDYRPDLGAWILANIPDCTVPFGNPRKKHNITTE
jgi:5-methylcytosine-specific restriction endonuclease McrA